MIVIGEEDSFLVRTAQNELFCIKRRKGSKCMRASAKQAAAQTSLYIFLKLEL